MKSRKQKTKTKKHNSTSLRRRQKSTGYRSNRLNQSRRQLKDRKDYNLIVIFAIIVIVSIVLTYSISPALAAITGISEWSLIFRHFTNLSIGILGFIIASRVPIHYWQKLQLPMVILTILSFIALLIPGVGIEVLGATRWINIAGFTFQPVELAKLTLLIYFASFLSSRHSSKHLDNISYTLGPLLVIIGLVGVFVVILQKDLGSMVVIVLMAMTMLLVSGIKYWQIALTTGIVSSASVIAATTVQHRVARLAAFFNPQNQTEETLYHIEQSLIAVGSGGLWGKGLGQSVQVYGYLPQAANDSIFSIYAEKVGFIGSVGLLFLYGALLYRLLLIMDKNNDYFQKLLVAGVSAWVFSHAAINIAAMLRLMPITGITLPFISFGGTSILFIMIALGIAFNCSSGLFNKDGLK